MWSWWLFNSAVLQWWIDKLKHICMVAYIITHSVFVFFVQGVLLITAVDVDALPTFPLTAFMWYDIQGIDEILACTDMEWG